MRSERAEPFLDVTSVVASVNGVTMPAFGADILDASLAGTSSTPGFPLRLTDGFAATAPLVWQHLRLTAAVHARSLSRPLFATVLHAV
jgi:hypothetical protein